MIPLTIPAKSAFGQPPDFLSDDLFASRAKGALEAKEAKNRSVLLRSSQTPRLEATTNNNSARHLIAPPVHRRRSTAPSVASGHQPEDFVFLDWGSEVKGVDLRQLDCLSGLAIVPVKDRKLVKIGFISARAVIGMQHADIVVPEVLLADYSTAGSGSVVMCEERARLSNVGIQADMDPLLRERALEALSLELNIDLSNFMSQIPAPCFLNAVDPWETYTAKQPQGPPVRHKASNATADDEGTAANSYTAAALRGSKVESITLLRKLLNTAEDPEGPPERVFPNSKAFPKRFVVCVSNTCHLFPPQYPIGVRSFSDFLVRRFRPEFVRDYHQPLLSTACYESCPIGSSNAAKLDIFHATLHLMNVVIPACAASLNAELKALTGEDLCNRLHMFGINLRFLGWLLPWILSTRGDVTKAILTEITARSYKKVEDKRDQVRHDKAEKKLLNDCLDPTSRSSFCEAASSGDPFAANADGGDDEDVDVEFSELTRIAVNKFYPYHLWVPLPKFCQSELQLLRRLHPKYGVVPDVLEEWTPEDLDNDDVVDAPQSAAEDKPFKDPSAGAYTTDGMFHVDGVDFTLTLDTASAPPTPHVENAYEFDPVLHPSVIDSQFVETRILDLVRRQRFVFLPGRFPVITRPHYLMNAGSASQLAYFDYLQECALRRAECLAQQSYKARVQVNNVLKVSSAPSSDGTVPPSSDYQNPRLYPLLRALAEVAFSLFPFELSTVSEKCGFLYVKHAVDMMKAISKKPLLPLENVDKKANTKKARGGSVIGMKQLNTVALSNGQLSDGTYWFCDALLHKAKLQYAGERDDDCVVSCQEALQLVRNARQRLQILQLQIMALQRKCTAAGSAAAADAAQEANKNDSLASSRVDYSDLDDNDEEILSNHHASTTAAVLQPLMLDVLRSIPLGLPPRHPQREGLYRSLLMVMESFLQREMVLNTLAIMSPASSQSSNMKPTSPGGAAAATAEGTAKEELALIPVERNFAGNGVPFDILSHLKHFWELVLDQSPVVSHFVSPLAVAFSFDEGRFPDSYANDSDSSGGATATALSHSDVMTVLDAFLSNDRVGLKALEEKNILVFSMHRGKSSVAVEVLTNIVRMRRMNDRSLVLVAAMIAAEEGVGGQALNERDGSDFNGSRKSIDSSNDMLSTTSSRQLSSHATLWATNRKQSDVVIAVPSLPLCSLLPIYIDCAQFAPYDETFLGRALFPLTDHQLRLLSQNPRLVLLLDGWDPRIRNTASDFRNVLSWKSKKVFLIARDQHSRMTPAELFDAMFGGFAAFPPNSDTRANVKATAAYAAMPLTTAQIFKALQMLELIPTASEFTAARKPNTAALFKKNAVATIVPRSHYLRSFMSRLLLHLGDPQLLTMVGRAIPLFVDLVKRVRYVSAADVFDAVVYTQFLSNEANPKTQSDALLYAMTLATLMSQTSVTEVKLEDVTHKYKHCLPIIVDGNSVRFVNNLFVSYFLSVRCTLEMLESEENPGLCFPTPFAAEMFTPNLATILKKSSLRRTKSELALKAVEGFMKKQPGQGALRKAFSKFSDARKRKLTGGEWLSKKELSVESDGQLIEFLADRCHSIGSFVQSLFVFGLNKAPSKASAAIVPNALTILGKAKVSLSGRSLRDIDLSRCCLDGVFGVAMDARNVCFGFASARNANFSFTDFNSSDFKAVDLGSDPKLNLKRPEATITCIVFSSHENDIMFTGDDFGCLVKWRVDIGEAVENAKAFQPLGRVAINPSATLVATCSATSDPRIQLWDAVAALRCVAVLSGHSAKVTSLSFCGDFSLASCGFDWQVLMWEVADDLVPPRRVAERRRPSGDDDDDSPEVEARVGAQSAPSDRNRQVSPKRVNRLKPMDAVVLRISDVRRAEGSPTRGRLLPADVIASTKLWQRPSKQTKPLTNGELSVVSLPESKKKTVYEVRPSRVLRMHHVHVTALGANEALRLVAILGGDGKGCIIQYEALKQEDGHPMPLRAVVDFCLSDVKGAQSLCFTTDGSKLAVPSTRGVSLLDTATARILLTFSFPGSVNAIPPAIDISDDNTLVAAAHDSHSCVWDASTGRLLIETKVSAAEQTFGPTATISTMRFTPRGKALIAAFWGGGVKVHPLTFSEHRDKIVSQDDTDPILTPEYRFFHVCNQGMHAAAVSFTGRVDVLEVESGLLLGSPAHLMEDIALCEADSNSDFVALSCPPLIHIVTLFRRIPRRVVLCSTKQLSTLCFAPHPSPSKASQAPTALLLGGSIDRSIRVWDCESGVQVYHLATDSAVAMFAPGHHRLLALCGFMSSRTLTLSSVDVRLFPTMSSQSKHKMGTGGKLYLTPEGDMPLAFQRLLLSCAKKRYGGLNHFHNIGKLMSTAVLPFLRQMVEVKVTEGLGVVKLPSKESVVRCAIGGDKDEFAAVSYDKTVTLWNLSAKELLHPPQEYHSGVISSLDISPCVALLHPGAIASNSNGRGILVASSAHDGTTAITVVSSGSRLVVIQPSEQRVVWNAKFVKKGYCGREALDGGGNHQLLTAGSDRVVRKWNLAGANCIVCSRHAVCSLGRQDLQAWLDRHHLSSLKGLLASKLGSDLLDFPPETVASMLLADLSLLQQPEQSEGLNALASHGALGLLRKKSSATFLPPLAVKQSGSGVAPNNSNKLTPELHRSRGEVEVPAAQPTAVDIERLRVLLKRVREQSYQTISSPALDDAELTSEMFECFTDEQLGAFFDFESQAKGAPILLAVAPAILAHRITASALRQCRTINDVKNTLVGNSSVEDMAKDVYNEISFIRNSRLKETFVEKSPHEIAQFSKSKGTHMQFMLLLLGYGGRELLSRTNFSMQTVIMCPECGRKIPDAKMSCSVRRGNHTHLVPQLEPDSLAGLTKLHNNFREALNTLAELVLEAISRLPSKVKTTCGMFWHPLLNDPGLIAVCQFSVAELYVSNTVVVNTASIHVTSTERTAPRMVVVVEEHPKQLQKMAGIKVKVDAPFRMAKLEFPTPTGWKKVGEWFGSQSTSSPLRGGDMELSMRRASTAGNNAGLRFLLDSHSQSTHPMMPVAQNSYSMSEVMATHVEYEPLSMGMASTVPVPKPPRPSHRFRKHHPAAESGDPSLQGEKGLPMFSLLGDHLANTSVTVTADVTDIVSHAISKGEKIIRMFIVAEGIADSKEHVAPTCRPVLVVNYYDEEKLCQCQSVAPWYPIKLPPPPRNSVQAASQATLVTQQSAQPQYKKGDGYLVPSFSTSPKTISPRLFATALVDTPQPQQYCIETGTVLCDRFCNVKTKCEGHRCPSSTSACRRAPFLIWESREARGGSYYGARLNNVVNLSSANLAHISERSELPPLDEGLSRMRGADDLKRRALVSQDSNVSGGSFGNDSFSKPAEEGSPLVFGAAAVPAALRELPPPTSSSMMRGASRTSITPMSDAPTARKKTVTITSFDDVLQARGLS